MPASMPSSRKPRPMRKVWSASRLAPSRTTFSSAGKRPVAPDHVPPEWPDGPIKQQVHLDLWVEDFAEAHEQVMALGPALAQLFADRQPTVVLGPESRGCVLGPLVAL